MQLLEKYQTTPTYRSLVEKHGLNARGIWLIKGEDPNCDFGGSHYKPTIAFVEGMLCDVIEAAVIHPKFWTWGSGGTISKVALQQVDKFRAAIGMKERLKEEIQNLEKRLEELGE